MYHDVERSYGSSLALLPAVHERVVGRAPMRLAGWHAMAGLQGNGHPHAHPGMPLRARPGHGQSELLRHSQSFPSYSEQGACSSSIAAARTPPPPLLLPELAGVPATGTTAKGHIEVPESPCTA